MGPEPVPAGWHPDPFGRHEVRYSDGRRWTEHVADGGVAGRDPAVPAGAEAAAPPPDAGPPPFAVPGRPWPATPPLWGPVLDVGTDEPARRRLVPLPLVWGTSALALVLVAALAAVTVRDSRDGAGRSGRFEASVAGVTDVDRYDVELDAGDVLAISAAPGAGLDLVVGYAADRVTTEAGYAVLSGASPTPDDVEAHLTGLRNDDLAFSDVAPEHGLYVLAAVDDQAEGGTEQVAVLAGAHGTYAVLVRGYSTTLGDYQVELGRTPVSELLGDRERFEQIFAGSDLTFEQYSEMFQD